MSPQVSHEFCRVENGFCKLHFVYVAPRRAAGEFNLAEGIRRKEVGQARTIHGDDWGARFDRTVVELARERVPFTSEQVTAVVGLPTSGSPSAVGARMTAAAKRGTIVKTGRRVKANRPNQHAAELTEWVGT